MSSCLKCAYNGVAYTQGFCLSSPDNDKTSKKPLKYSVMEELIKYLKACYDYCVDNEESLDVKSWGYEEGILITANNAKTIIEACEGKPDSTSKKDLRVCEVSNSLPSDVKEIISFLQWMFRKIDKGDTPAETVRMLTMLRNKIESVNLDGNGR